MCKAMMKQTVPAVKQAIDPASKIVPISSDVIVFSMLTDTDLPCLRMSFCAGIGRAERSEGIVKGV
jgi:hypothetical protein